MCNLTKLNGTIINNTGETLTMTTVLGDNGLLGDLIVGTFHHELESDHKSPLPEVTSSETVHQWYRAPLQEFTVCGKCVKPHRNESLRRQLNVIVQAYRIRTST